MSKGIKNIFMLLLCTVFVMSLGFYGSAKGSDIYNNTRGVLCIAHGGDTALYPKNSPEGIKSAFLKGADLVSAEAEIDPQGEAVLCDDDKTPLKELLGELSEEEILILDVACENKDKLYEALKAENSLGNVFIRTEDSVDELEKWLADKDSEAKALSVCDSFNIFTVLSQLNKASQTGIPAIGLQSKNYFNVMYGSVCYSRYSAENMPRVIAPAYDPDLCGQRSDSQDGWNELIKKNFSVIETANLDSFIRYTEDISLLRRELTSLVEKARTVDTAGYSSHGKEIFTKALSSAEILLSDGIVSCDELQQSKATLLLATEKAAKDCQEDSEKGPLNITAGKVIAVVLVGAALIAAEIFIIKMQKGKKR